MSSREPKHFQDESSMSESSSGHSADPDFEPDDEDWEEERHRGARGPYHQRQEVRGQGRSIRSQGSIRDASDVWLARAQARQTHQQPQSPSERASSRPFFSRCRNPVSSPASSPRTPVGFGQEAPKQGSLRAMLEEESSDRGSFRLSSLSSALGEDEANNRSRSQLGSARSRSSIGSVRSRSSGLEHMQGVSFDDDYGDDEVFESQEKEQESQEQVEEEQGMEMDPNHWSRHVSAVTVSRLKPAEIRKWTTQPSSQPTPANISTPSRSTGAIPRKMDVRTRMRREEEEQARYEREIIKQRAAVARAQESRSALIPCPYCDKQISSKAAIVKHIRTVHHVSPPEEVNSLPRTARPMRECPGCGHLFSDAHLARHMGICPANQERIARANSAKKRQQQGLRTAHALRAERRTRAIENLLRDGQVEAAAALVGADIDPRDPVPVREDLLDPTDEGRVDFWKVLNAYYAAENSAESTQRIYNMYINQLFDFFAEHNNLNPNDLVDFFAGESDRRLPRLIPSCNGFFTVKHDQYSVHTKAHVENAYQTVCKSVVWFLAQYPDQLKEPWRMEKGNHFSCIGPHYQLMREENAKNVKRSVRAKKLDTQRRRWEGENDPSKTTSSDLKLYYAQYLQSDVRQSRQQKLLDPKRMIEFCKTQRGYCQVRDFLMTELMMTGGANRGELALLITHRQWIDSHVQEQRDADGDMVESTVAFLGKHKTGSVAPAYITIIDPAVSALLTIFATRITGPRGFIPAVGFTDQPRDIPIFRNYIGTRMTRHPGQIVIDVFRHYSGMPEEKDVSLHDFRNLQADWGAHEGINVDKLAAAMNHSVQVHRTTYRTGAVADKVSLTNQFLRTHKDMDLGGDNDSEEEDNDAFERRKAREQRAREENRRANLERQALQAEQRRLQREEEEERKKNKPQKLHARKTVPTSVRDDLIRLFPEPDFNGRPPRIEWDAQVSLEGSALNALGDEMQALHPECTRGQVFTKLNESYRCYYLKRGKGKGGKGKGKGKGGKANGKGKGKKSSGPGPSKGACRDDMGWSEESDF